MNRFPEIWLEQLQSLQSFTKIIVDNTPILMREASAGVSQKRICDSIDGMLSGLDDMIDRMERAGATIDEIEEVEDIRSLLETTSLELKIQQAEPKS